MEDYKILKHYPRSRRRQTYMYRNAHMNKKTFRHTFGHSITYDTKFTGRGIPFSMISVLVPYCTRRFRAKIRKHYPYP